MPDDDERIALFLDFENLAIGARETGIHFDIKVINDALAERGRVVARRAYADWSQWEEDARSMTRGNVELIAIPQRMGAVRKNAADIKLAVDAVELAFERDYITTIVIGTGDSDFTPLVDKLRTLNRRVIGIGMKASTSNLLPGACDEFLFYESLEGAEQPAPQTTAKRRKPARLDEPPTPSGDEGELAALVTQTLSGLERTTSAAIYASTLKRAILRKDPTFSETNYGFRAFGELLKQLERRKVVELIPGPAKGDPEVVFPSDESGEEHAFLLLESTVHALQDRREPAILTGLKNEIRRREPDFSEKEFGFGGFLQFCRAARSRGYVDMEWDDSMNDYVLRVDRAAT